MTDPRSKNRLGLEEPERALFDAMPQLGWVAGADGSIAYYNRRWYEYTGATPEAMVGWGWQSVHDPAHLPAVLEGWRAALAKGEPFQMAFPLRRRDGTFHWFMTYASPIRNDRNEVVRWIGINTDIDDQRRAQARLAKLTELALALSRALTSRDVADVIVDEGMRSARADTCTLYALDESGEVLRLLAHRGVATEVVDRIRRITRTEGNPRGFRTLGTGESVWVETADEYAAIFPAIAGVPATGRRAKAFWSVPLIVERKPIGLLGMGFYEEQKFSVGDRAFVDTFAKQCGQALALAQVRDRETAARQWLSTTLQSIGDAVIATDVEGRISLMNSVAEGLTGWRAGEARGRRLEDVFAIFSEETRAPSESPVARVLREGSVVGLANHTVLRSRDGKERPIDDSAAPIRDAEGNLFGVVLVFRDASFEKRENSRRDFLARASATLASSLDYRETLAAVTRIAVPQLADWCKVDIVESGTNAPQQLALSHVDPSKVEWARQLGERYPPDLDAPTGPARVIRTGKSELYAEIPASLLEARARDGEHLRVLRELQLESAIVVPLRAREHNLGAMTFVYAGSGRHYTPDDLGFAEEFARRAAMAIENARAVKDAQEARAEEGRLRAEADIANRAKDEFLATVSHELRTPLNAILGWTVTLRGQAQPPDTERALGIIERNARKQVRLIDDVLDVSRVISGKLSLALGPTNIAEIIEGAIEAVSPAAEAKGVAIHVEAEAALVITADSDRMQQVVWNLLANAVKFTAKSGTIAIASYRQGSDVCIRVKDDGEGIPPEALPHVFEAFRQADSSTTRAHGGLGLGLAIVKQLVTAHGGTVQATSEGKGHGATFVVTIPTRSAMTAVAEAAASPGETTATFADAARAERLDGLLVLIVDDEEDARSVIEHILRAQGAAVHAARTAKEALDLLEALRPDVIVSDIGMPDMDGYDLIRKVRSLAPSRGGRTPAIALTAYARKEDAQRAFAAGYQMHVSKPVEPGQLAEAVATLILR